jgi:argininosuccinate lyase
VDKKLWGGRFESELDEFAAGFNSSISFDYRLYKQDILGSIAHAKMLGKQDIIDFDDSKTIIKGLKAILLDIENGQVEFSADNEDIHMNIEKLLIAKIGEVGKKLHTGRSRNDQVALDTRMWLKDEINDTCALLKDLLSVIIKISEENLDTIMPSYTHLQKAQPTTLAHYMMAYFEMFKRDLQRFEDCFKRVDVMPLGAGALCATTYPLDRQFVADELGFSAITDNSMDTVSDRDYNLEYLFCASTCQMHLSRMSEEIILWSSNEFDMIRISDGFSTGSSIMPQKKNADIAELVRGKSGRVYGNLVSLLTTMKGLPLAYNKDMQEDKEPLFDTVNTIKTSVKVFAKMLSEITFNKEKMLVSAGKGFTNATDLADYLVKKGLEFRNAHEVSGKVVLHCEKNGLAILDLNLYTLRKFSDLFEEDVFEEVSLLSCVQKRTVYGGPSRQSVQKHIQKAKNIL